MGKRREEEKVTVESGNASSRNSSSKKKPLLGLRLVLLMAIAGGWFGGGMVHNFTLNSIFSESSTRSLRYATLGLFIGLVVAVAVGLYRKGTFANLEKKSPLGALAIYLIGLIGLFLLAFITMLVVYNMLGLSTFQ